MYNFNERHLSYDCFISYASADLAHAELLYQRLKNAGFTVWFDKARLREGCDWHREIEVGCESSRVILPVLTPRWKLSEWTRYETYGAEAVLSVIAEGNREDIVTPPLTRLQISATRLEDRTEADWQNLYGAIRKVISSPAPGKAERITHLRYHTNPSFVGRHTELNDIHEKLFTNPATVLTQRHTAAVTALGGIGKTTLARQYAEKFWRCYRQMFWVDCRRAAESEFAAIHDILRPEPLYREEKIPDKARWAFLELQQQERPLRLLIIDNAEDEESIAPWIPKSGNCHTIITSRFSRWSPGVETCPVWILKPEPARELLLRRAARPNATEEWADGAALAKKLGYLPLALEQAGAYVAQQGPAFLFADYLRLSDTHDNEWKLLAERSLGSTEYPQPVFLTWRTTIDKLPAGPRAILRVCAFMASAPIPTEILVKGAGIIAKEAGEARAGEFEIREWMSALARYSMIQLMADADSFSIHGLVQAVERFQVPEAERPRKLEQAADLLMACAPTPSYDFKSWPYWTIARPHAQKFWEQQLHGGIAQSPIFLLEYGSFLSVQGSYADAIQVLSRACEICHTMLGADHPETLRSVNSLALSYTYQGRHDKAQTLFEHSLRDSERVLGLNHPEVLVAVSNLAGLYERQGRYDEAKPLFQRALRDNERILGANHPNTVRAANNLGALCSKLGDYNEAEPLLQRSLRVSEQVLGAKHPETLRAANNLGFLYEITKHYSRAEALYQRTLRDRETVLGTVHPETILSVINLANLYTEQRRYADAEPLYQRAVRDSELVLGTDHPQTLTSVSNLAVYYSQERRYAEAEPLYRRAAEGFRRTLGDAHPDTVNVTAQYQQIQMIRRLPTWLQRLLRL